jgi:SecY interacting protein Syd
LTLSDAIDTFFDHYRLSHEQLLTDYDPEWPSPCEIGEPITTADPPQIAWQPVRRHALADDFAGLENALETEIHPDIKTYYGRYWSANLAAEAPDGHVSLLFVWNQADVDRLIENLIGHALACRQNKAPFSVFFACTEDDSDLFLSVNNVSGEVQLEKPGTPPLRTVADSLADFLPYLVPAKN